MFRLLALLVSLLVSGVIQSLMPREDFGVVSTSGRLLSWDQTDRNMSVTQAGVTVSYVRDTEGRVRLRVRGGFAEQRMKNATLVESAVSLPGGVLLSKRPNAVDDLRSFPNLHGDVMINTNNSGVLQGGLRFYSPDGVSLTVTNPTVVGGVVWVVRFTAASYGVEW
jgi:hypothetical protein